MTINQLDNNYNTKITFEDNSQVLIFSARLINENLTAYKGWRCAAGVTSIDLYQNKVFSAGCRNDFLGFIDQDWNLLEQHTVCKLDRCSFCFTDLLQEKYEP